MSRPNQMPIPCGASNREAAFPSLPMGDKA